MKPGVVKRNLTRFPGDFMFQLSAEEFAALRSQSVISSAKSKGHGGRRTAPYAFTEQGVARLSSVLSSPRAVAVNIEIMCTFVRVRALASTHADLAQRLAELEDKTEALVQNHDTFSRYYNHDRIRSTLGGLSPVEYRQLAAGATALNRPAAPG